MHFILLKLVMTFKSSKLIFIVFIPLILVITFFIIQFSDRLSLLDRSMFYVGIGCDEDDGGSSICSGGLQDDGSYKLNYILGDKYDYPYANFYINRYGSELMDFSNHDQIKINIKSVNSRYLEIRAYLFIKGFTSLGDHSTYLPISYTLSVTDSNKDYLIDINDLKVPHWWYSSNNKRINNVDDYFDSVIYFEISHISDKVTGVEDSITLYGVTIQKSIYQTLIKLLIFLTIYYILLYLIFRFINYRNQKNIKIPYTQVSLKEEPLENSEIEDYIGNNYSNPNICMTLISQDINMSAKSISEYINNKYNLNFPSYLNSIRITEAKRLLGNHDLKILDIAISVGYSSAGHFNRIFKQFENITPTEFRKRNS